MKLKKVNKILNKLIDTGNSINNCDTKLDLKVMKYDDGKLYFCNMCYKLRSRDKYLKCSECELEI